MWYFRPKQYLAQTFTRSGEGIFMMGKNAQNTAQVMNVPTTSGNGSVTTAVSGTGYTSLSDQICGSVTIVNDTGTSLDVTKDGGTTKMVVPTGAAYCVKYIENANQVSVRRTDNSATQVTAYYEWEG